jgi:hypothetical protein
MITRRSFLKLAGASTVALYMSAYGKFLPRAWAAIPGGTLDPMSISKYVTPLLIPPVMPKAGTVKTRTGQKADYYEISMKQFAQQILPAGMPMTTVWGYGAVSRRAPPGLLLHNAPSLPSRLRPMCRCARSGSMDW